MSVQIPQRLSSLKKGTKILFAILLLLSCCSCLMIMSVIGNNLPPEIRVSSSETNMNTSDRPTKNVKLSCVNAHNVTINEATLTNQQIVDLCGSKGYDVVLQDGNNQLLFVAGDGKGRESKLELNISFDLTAYNKRIADEELKRQQAKEEEDRLKAERDRQDAERRAQEEAEANKPKVGDSLSGPSFKEIKQEYERQNNLSSYKGDQYLESLKGQKIIWVGMIGDVNDEFIGDDLYISIHLNSGVVQSELAYVNNPKEEDLDLNADTVVKVTGNIEEIHKGIFGLSAYLYNADIETL